MEREKKNSHKIEAKMGYRRRDFQFCFRRAVNESGKSIVIIHWLIEYALDMQICMRGRKIEGESVNSTILIEFTFSFLYSEGDLVVFRNNSSNSSGNVDFCMHSVSKLL